MFAELDTELKVERLGRFIVSAAQYFLTCEFEKDGVKWLENIIVEVPEKLDKPYLNEFIAETIEQNELDGLVVTFIWKFE